MVTISRRHRHGLALAALALLAACDIPSSAPRWQTTWNVPADSTRITVAELLPNGVTVAPGNTAFQVAVSPVSITRTLGQDCGVCAVANGTTVPKPAFQVSTADTTTLPPDLASATLLDDTLTVQVVNGFDFDPIRPSASANGTLTLAVTNGVDTLGKLAVTGATAAIPAGATTVFRVPLAGTVSGAAGIRVALFVDSPAGDPVTIDTASTIGITATVGTFSVSQATVTVFNQTVESPVKAIDLTDVTSDVSDRVAGGTVDLTITNPFGVVGPVTLALDAPNGIQVVKRFQLAADATATTRLDFTADELRSLLGKNVGMTLTGIVSAPSNTVTVTPDQAVDVTTRLQMTLTTGGN